ncbi:MAG: lipopolysaccharide transport periplasmic protein LptA [Halioglobus sp.]
MRLRRDRLMPGVFVTLALLLPGLGSALPDDRDQPIRIEADEALRDEKQGFTRYEGNVRMDQGSLHIEADQITVYHDDKEANRVVATGKPARLQQQPELEKGPIKASADTIEYFKSEDRIQLRENANIEQEGSIVTGDSIDYLMNEQLVKAGSDKNRDSSRVKVVIPAGLVSEEER